MKTLVFCRIILNTKFLSHLVAKSLASVSAKNVAENVNLGGSVAKFARCCQPRHLKAELDA
jgi:hypothetical protein